MEENVSPSPPLFLSAALLQLTTQDALGDAERHVAGTDEANLPLPLHVRVHFDLLSKTGRKPQVNCAAFQTYYCVFLTTQHILHILKY